MGFLANTNTYLYYMCHNWYWGENLRNKSSWKIKITKKMSQSSEVRSWSRGRCGHICVFNFFFIVFWIGLILVLIWSPGSLASIGLRKVNWNNLRLLLGILKLTTTVFPHIRPASIIFFKAFNCGYY